MCNNNCCCRRRCCKSNCCCQNNNCGCGRVCAAEVLAEAATGSCGCA